QDDAATLQLDLEQGALGQPQRMTHRRGQGDLAAFGYGGFHRTAPRMKRYARIIHTSSAILEPAYPPAARISAVSGPEHDPAKTRDRPEALLPQEPPPWPIRSPPATPCRSAAKAMPMPAWPGSAGNSTSGTCPTR